MNTGLLHLHSGLRYLVLVALLVVIVKSLLGWLNKKPFASLDNKISLYLLIFTHLQFVVGLVLYFVSNMVQFNSETMKNSTLRYWAVEHVLMMVIAVTLITAARSTSKKMSNDTAKHKRLFIFNTLALIIILTALQMSGRGIIPGL